MKIVARLVHGLLTLFFVSVLLFVGTEILPGDVAQSILGQSATPESLAAIRDQLGLQHSPADRYVRWLTGMAQLDFGRSLANGVPVTQLVMDRLWKTLLLAGLAGGVAIPIALVLGLAAAMKPGSAFDRTISAVCLGLAALPEFLIATLLVLVFAVNLHWFPAISYVTEFRSIGQLLSSLVLPVATLTLIILAQLVRMTRGAVVNVLGTPYIEMAVLKGLPTWRIVLLHALPNAMGPIVNVIALNLAYLVSGVVIVEAVFAYPGLGRLMVDAVASRDVPVIQACAILFSIAYLVLMLVADMVAGASNPRLSQSR